MWRPPCARHGSWCPAKLPGRVLWLPVVGNARANGSLRRSASRPEAARARALTSRGLHGLTMKSSMRDLCEFHSPFRLRMPAVYLPALQRRRPAMRKHAIQPKVKVWVAFGSDVKFGDGRARLLERIDSLGSIQKAVAEFGMSYRNVWGYLK